MSLGATKNRLTTKVQLMNMLVEQKNTLSSSVIFLFIYLFE